MKYIIALKNNGIVNFIIIIYYEIYNTHNFFANVNMFFFLIMDKFIKYYNVTYKW